MSTAALAAWLSVGALLGAVLAGVAHAMGRGGRRLLAVALMVAAVIYVGFAFRAEHLVTWLGIESAGVALFGGMGWLGLRGSAWWIAAGWALHPLWDVVLHHAGPGAGIAPGWYAIACIGFDLVVAAYAATRILNASGGRWRTAGS